MCTKKDEKYGEYPDPNPARSSKAGVTEFFGIEI